jgi:hypothetical protein
LEPERGVTVGQSTPKVPGSNPGPATKSNKGVTVQNRSPFSFTPYPGDIQLDVKTSKRYSGAMKTAIKRATVYFDSQIHRGLRLKAAETDRSISDLVNDAVKLSLAEDAEDIAAFKERGNEPNLAFEDVLNDLRKRGKL